MSIVFASFKHPKLPISIKIPVTLLQIVYICMTAIFMNYLFANLLVAWLFSDQLLNIKLRTRVFFEGDSKDSDQPGLV